MITKYSGYLNESELTIEDIKNDDNLRFYLTQENLIQKESGYVIIRNKVYFISMMNVEYINDELREQHKVSETSNGIFFDVIFDDKMKFEVYIQLVMVSYFDL